LTRSFPRLRPLLPALAIGAIALSVRLAGLDAQSVTMDEVAELGLARLSIPEIVRSHDGFPPLYLLMLKGWLELAGPHSGRWLSVLLGMLIIPPAWHLGRIVGGLGTAWVAAGLVAISPIHVWYAQEARPNILFFLLAALAVWLFFRGMQEAGRRDWFWYAVVSLAGLYTHYYFLLLIAGLLASVPLAGGWRSRLPALTLVHGALALGAVGWIWLLPTDFDLQSGYLAPHLPLDLKSLAYTLVSFLFGFSAGPSLGELHVSRTGSTLLEAVPWGIAALAVCLLLLAPAWRDPVLRRWGLRLGIVILVPMVICGIAASAFDLGYRVRYVGWGATVLTVLLAAGLSHGWSRPAPMVGGLALVALSCVSLANRLWNPRYANEAAREAATYLEANASASSPVFVVSGYMAGPVEHYLGTGYRLLGLPVPDAGEAPDNALNAIQAEVGPGERFWLLYSRPWDGDPGGRLRDELLARARLRPVMEWPGMKLYEGIGW
jgi:hypothetical protein